MPITSSDNTSPLYAVIDLGSNSFHMLVTRQLANSVQIVDKVKRKVRLASGLDQHNVLSEKAMARGLECLHFFAERLQDIPPNNIRIVATATLRIASNNHCFLQQAEKILGYPINLLSGKAEAEYIYQGVAHTCATEAQRLVIDIGGASTELIVGERFKALAVTSINMGCVTYKQNYFKDDLISAENFENAFNAAKEELIPLTEHYQNIGWDIALSGSGTMQALIEILSFQNKPSIVTFDFLHELQKQVLTFKHISEIKIAGLSVERIPVLVSGLAILHAIFTQLGIHRLHLSDGALREGLLYEMLDSPEDIGIRTRTINSLAQRFHIDTKHAERVKKQAQTLFFNLQTQWKLNNQDDLPLLNAACDLHEIGLLLSFKRHQEHGAYIIKNLDLPGFNSDEKQLLAALILQYKENVQPDLLKKQRLMPYEKALSLLIILRISVILCRRRKDDALPQYKTSINQTHISLGLPQAWLNTHPLIFDELLQENEHLKCVSFSLSASE